MTNSTFLQSTNVQKKLSRIFGFLDSTGSGSKTVVIYQITVFFGSVSENSIQYK
jgi:hypothetical protein